MIHFIVCVIVFFFCCAFGTLWIQPLSSLYIWSSKIRLGRRRRLGLVMLVEKHNVAQQKWYFPTSEKDVTEEVLSEAEGCFRWPPRPKKNRQKKLGNGFHRKKGKLFSYFSSLGKFFPISLLGVFCMEWAGVGVACVLSDTKWCEVFFLSAYRNMTSS